MAEHGYFHWNELSTSDVEKAKAFYGRLVGWTFEAMPMEGFTYWIIKPAGGELPAGGIWEVPAGGPMPTDFWMSYLALSDVDAAVAGVAAAGGTVEREPFDIPGVGRIAIVKDATGAVMGWITPAPMEG